MSGFRPTEAQAQAAPDAGDVADDEIIDFIGARLYEPIIVPRTKYRGKMRVVSRNETFALKAAARKFFEAEGMPLDNHAAFGAEEWTNEIALRMLAVAVRNPRDPSMPLASLDEWRELDDDQVDKLWTDYRDFAERVDPVGQRELTDQEFEAIDRDAKKKRLDLTMLFGSRRLALYAMRLAARPTS